MKIMGIESVIRRAGKKNKSNKPDEVAENLLKRLFNVDAPNKVWATDVTEFKIPGTNKKLYLSAIIDLYDRPIVAWVISKRNDNNLVMRTFEKALEANPGAKPLLHIDRGFQYTSKAFKHRLEKAGMTQSMSRVGHCIDNGPTEGLWGIIKAEMYELYEANDEQSLYDAINSYINFYNYDRLQERFEAQTPMQVREEALKTDNPKQYPIAENKRILNYKESLKQKKSAEAYA